MVLYTKGLRSYLKCFMIRLDPIVGKNTDRSLVHMIYQEIMLRDLNNLLEFDELYLFYNQNIIN